MHHPAHRASLLVIGSISRLGLGKIDADNGQPFLRSASHSAWHLMQRVASGTALRRS